MRSFFLLKNGIHLKAVARQISTGKDNKDKLEKRTEKTAERTDMFPVNCSRFCRILKTVT